MHVSYEHDSDWLIYYGVCVVGHSTLNSINSQKKVTRINYLRSLTTKVTKLLSTRLYIYKLTVSIKVIQD